MPARQQPQHLTVILERDRSQVPMPERDDGGRSCVVRIGLVLAARVQQPRSCRQRCRHIHNVLACADQLLRQQRADPGRALDRPQSRFELRRPRQQSATLITISTHRYLADELLVAVDDYGRV
jgi:hypothetical protein